LPIKAIASEEDIQDLVSLSGYTLIDLDFLALLKKDLEKDRTSLAR